MKKIWIFLLLSFTITLSSAQKREGFSTEPEKFMKELEKALKDTKRDDAKAAGETMSDLWETGAFTPEQQQSIISTANYMLERRMQIYPYFQSFTQTLIDFSANNIPDEKFQPWLESLNRVMQDSRKGSHTDFNEYIEFSRGLFNKNAIYTSQAKDWISTSAEYKFIYDSVPKLIIPALDLYAYTRGDTIVIHNTGGVYEPLETRWHGKRGTVYWTRANIDSTEVYAHFGPHVIDISRSLYTVDSVTFSYPEFLDYSLKGQLTDKLVADNDPERSSYPRFDSYKKDIRIDDLAERVNFKGGVSLHGSRLIGTGAENDKVELQFFSRTDSLAVRARAKEMLIKKGEEVFADRSEVTIFMGEDSIYHPGLDLTFKIPKRELRLLRGQQGIAKTNFSDSYHQMEVETEMIEWALDSTTIKIDMLIGKGKQPAYFISKNYFEQGQLDKYQNIADYNPVHVIKKYAEDYGTHEIDATNLAQAMNPSFQSVEPIRRLLYLLVEEGFVYYDEDKEIVTVREKTFNYVFANAELMDYDVIKIKSLTPKTYGKLNLLNYSLNLEGVRQVTLSDSQFVLIFPKNRQLTIMKNRDMEFDGTVFAGRMDFHGQGFTFSYDDFKLGLNKVDSFQINIPSKQMDAEGKPVLVPLKSVIEGLTGGLYIDAPDNKSGKEHIPMYPMFESLKESYVYYYSSEILNGVYPRDRFYFELDPFVIDSMDTFDPAALEFEGSFISASIFPDFREKLRIQKDRSLGFITTSPPFGYPVYQGAGRFTDSIYLSHDGLRGKGKIDFLASTANSRDVIFFPDSLNANAEDFTLEKTTYEGTEYPAVENKDIYIHWVPYNDSMYVNQKTSPFTFYEGQSVLDGNIVLTSKGLSGEGEMEWEEAILASNQFRFKSDVFDADTSFLQMKSLDPTQMAFSAPNVNSHVDFKKRMGEFKSNSKDFPVTFPYNQYKTSIQEFTWFMDDKVIDFKAPPKLEDSYFTSLHREQDSLTFHGTGAKYDLKTNLLEVFGIPHIYVADAQIIPDTGYAAIDPGAKMRTLKNAVVNTDTMKYYHKIYEADINIAGRKDYSGSGKYDYINKTKEKQQIYFSRVFVEGDKKKYETLTTKATGKIPAEQNFVLNPRIKFKGDAHLNARQKYLTFDGFAKLEQNNTNITTQWFSFSSEINPDSLFIRIKDPRNEQEEPLFVGIHRHEDDGQLYTTFINNKKRFQDHDVFLSEGLLQVNEDKNEFVIGKEEKMKGRSLKGNLYRYNDKEGKVSAEGKINLGADFGLIKVETAGSIDNDINNNTYAFDLVMGITFDLAPELMEMLAKDLMELTYDLPDVTYEKPAFERAVVEFVDDKKVKDISDNLHKTGTFKKPKEIAHTFLFTNVTMKWDTAARTFYSEGPISLGYVGETPVNKKLKAYIEFGSKRSGDFFNIYIKAGMEDWYYFNYKSSTLYIATSNEEFIKGITAVDPEKRRTKQGNIFYQYTPGSERQMQKFVEEFEMNYVNQ